MRKSFFGELALGGSVLALVVAVVVFVTQHADPQSSHVRRADAPSLSADRFPAPSPDAGLCRPKATGPSVLVAPTPGGVSAPDGSSLPVVPDPVLHGARASLHAPVPMDRSVDGDGAWKSEIDRSLSFPHVPDQLLVRFRPKADLAARQAVMETLHAVSGKPLDISKHSIDEANWILLQLPRGTDLKAEMEAAKGLEAISVLEPNGLAKTDAVPNDPDFAQMVGLHNTGQFGGTPGADIHALDAWNVTTGSAQVIVAVIDTGVDYTHVDLAPNMMAGYDFYDGTSDPMDTYAGEWHGTHVAGIIGADGNNGVGISGVCWHVRLMPLKVFGTSGQAPSSAIASAIQYAAVHGASVINMSMTSLSPDQAEKDAIGEAQAHGVLVCAAAGNAGVDNDVTPSYPASYNYPNIIAVAASDERDQRAIWGSGSSSNWGATSVHLAAPGSDILSTKPGNAYWNMSGTSMATPHVSGVAALIKALRPDFGYAQIKQAILQGVDPVSGFRGRCITGGRLNAATSLAIAAAAQAPQFTSPTPGSALASSTATFVWSGPSGVTRYWLYVGSSEGAYDVFNQDLSLSLSATVSGLPTDGRTLYVRLWFLDGGAWLYTDALYQAASAAVDPELINPTPGSRLTSSTETFLWSAGSNVNDYWLYVGTSQGGHDLFSQNMGLDLSATVYGLPMDGSTIYLRLWFLESGAWHYSDSLFAAAIGAVVEPEVTSPTPGSRLTSSAETFAWNAGSGADRFWLYVGTSQGGHDLFNQDMGFGQSATVLGLPTDGSTVYLRLWFLESGVWHYSDSLFAAMEGGSADPVMLDPTPGSRLTSSTATFTWSAGSSVNEYWIWIGSSQGRHDLADQDMGLDLSDTLSGLPTDGSTIYVRLWFLKNGAWQYTDSLYEAW